MRYVNWHIVAGQRGEIGRQGPLTSLKARRIQDGLVELLTQFNQIELRLRRDNSLVNDKKENAVSKTTLQHKTGG